MHRRLGAQAVEFGIGRRRPERYGLVELLEESPGFGFVLGDLVHELPRPVGLDECTALTISGRARATWISRRLTSHRVPRRVRRAPARIARPAKRSADG